MKGGLFYSLPALAERNFEPEWSSPFLVEMNELGLGGVTFQVTHVRPTGSSSRRARSEKLSITD